MEANYVEGREISLSVLSPSAIKKLLLQMLKKPPPASDYRWVVGRACGVPPSCDGRGMWAGHVVSRGYYNL